MTGGGIGATGNPFRVGSGAALTAGRSSASVAGEPYFFDDMLFIGIDSGTQSTKAIVLDADSGEILAHAAQGYDVIGGLPAGHMEQHAETWVEATFKAVEACLAAIGGRRSEVRGIGVSGQQHGMVALDKDGVPVRAAK